jgi:hypothetical protein
MVHARKYNKTGAFHRRVEKLYKRRTPMRQTNTHASNPFIFTRVKMQDIEIMILMVSSH